VTERALTLYSRAGCPLCDEMAAAFGALLAVRGIGLRQVDVDVDPVLKARFGWDVPLLFDGDREICRHYPDLAALQHWLGETP
jgi:hypothetical protein